MTFAERESSVRGLKERIAAFRDEQFGPYITEVMVDAERSYPPPALRPDRLPHPRVMITREMLPRIRSAFNNPECACAAELYRKLLEKPTDGILPPAYLHESGRRGEHNFDYEVLAVIEARALEYLLSGESYYGYRAILNMMNFLTTLDIAWIPSDQCREFGITMYTAALVYDWCYDLMGEDEKRRFTLGVEHLLCRGNSRGAGQATYGGVRMEIGFPPTRNGCVTGHGSEMQLLRDYLAYSIAIYDEVPGWWSFVGARFENEYLPVRREFYAAGMYPQGMSCYAPHRYICDLWSAWLLKTLSGENPYPEQDMKRVIRSMLSNETVDRHMFPSGDGGGNTLGAVTSYCAVMSSYLFDDGTARAAALYLKEGATEFDYSYVSITPTVFLLCSMNSIETAADRHKELTYLSENRGYMNQYVIRNGWTGDACVVLMKAGGRGTMNHEHANAGSFQIWHKCALTGDVGLYSGYGSNQHAFFHCMSIAHNTLLIYNPDKHDSELVRDENGRETNRHRYWYSGGQRRIGEAQDLGQWMQDEYLTGETPIMQAEEGERPRYAYLSTDITRAYDKDTVRFVKRVMLTSFATDGSTPMVFFVFDRVESVSPDFKKTFLLQVPGPEAPVCDGGSISLLRDGARLTLTPVSEATVELVGGGRGCNYLVNGVQCAPPEGRDRSVSWGRIELSRVGEEVSFFCNAITVGDADAPPVAVTPIEGGGICGAYSSGVAAVFRQEREVSTETFSFTLPHPTETYLSGLSTGAWVASADGSVIAEASVPDGGDMAVLSLPAGKITLSRK